MSINIGNGNAAKIVLSGGDSSTINLSSKPISGGSQLTSYQRAVMAGYLGTEGEFYQEMADRMAGVKPATSGSNGLKLVNGDMRLSIGDGTRVTLTS